MKNFIVYSLALLSILIWGSCADVNKSGDQPTQVKESSKLTTMKQFLDVNVVGSMQVFYTQDSKNTVRVEAQKEEFDKLVIYVKENELYISSKNENVVADSLVAMQDVKVYVTSPSLREVTMTGEGSFTAKEAIETTHLDASLTGSGSISFAGKITSKSFSVELVGDGCVNVADLNCKKLYTQVTGSGAVNYASLIADNAESVITGSGRIAMKGVVTEHTRKISGSGEISITHLN